MIVQLVLYLTLSYIPGHYQSDPGATICGECEAGRYYTTLGASFCIDCLAGRYSNINGSLDCTACDYGSFQSEVGKSYCNYCPVGKFSTAQAENLCTDCSPGYYNDVQGRTYCTQCQQGTYTSIPGMGKCSNCNPGTIASSSGQSSCNFCNIGTFAPTQGLSSCSNCIASQYQDQLSQSKCNTCPVGFTTTEPAQSICLGCSPGRYGLNNGTCLDCPSGSYSDQTNSSGCSLCAAGKYSNSGADKCTQCPNNFATSIPGSSSCTICPSNSNANLEQSSCDCAIGYYLTSSYIPGINVWPCDVCPLGADCTSAGQVYDTLKNQYGWWRYSNSTVTFYQCLIRAYCPADQIAGGNTATGAQDTGVSNVCANNRNGIMCSQCVEGYHNQIGTGCVACPSTTTSWSAILSAIIILIVILFVFWLSLFIVLNSGKNVLKVQSDDGLANNNAIDESNIENSEQEQDYEDKIDWAVSPRNESINSEDSSEADESKKGTGEEEEQSKKHKTPVRNEEDDNNVSDDSDRESSEGQESEIESEIGDDSSESKVDPATINLTTLYGPPPPPNDFTYILKIFVGFLQIVTNLGTGLQITWPNTFKSFVVTFDFINLDNILSNVTSADCISAINYYNKWVVIVLIPPVILFLSLVFYLIPYYFECFCFRHITVYQRQYMRMKFWKIFLYLLFFVYPSISSTVIRLYICQEIDQGDGISNSYLLTDLRVQCYTNTWTLFAYIGFPLLLVYPIGIPLFFFILLRSNQKNLHKPTVEMQLGFLYSGYKSYCWWFEILETIVKLSLTSLLAFAPTYFQLPLGMIISGAYTCIILILHPYLRRQDDLFHLFCMTEIFLLLFAGLLYYNLTGANIDPFDDNIVGVALIIICLFILALFFLLAVLLLKGLIQRWWTKRTLNKSLKSMKNNNQSIRNKQIPVERVLSDSSYSDDDSESENKSNNSNNSNNNNKAEHSHIHQPIEMDFQRNNPINDNTTDNQNNNDNNNNNNNNGSTEDHTSNETQQDDKPSKKVNNEDNNESESNSPKSSQSVDDY